jgi:hypothetical protein
MQTLQTHFEQIPVETVKKIAQPLHTTHEPAEEDWRDLARQASIEEDPEKLLDLLQQVIETYDEAKRRGRRQSTTVRL